jgi:DNA-binding beta-propeller fold protein YncE
MTIEEVPQVAEDEDIAEQSTEGRLVQPRGVATNQAGLFYVADFGNDRIQVFDGSFAFLRGWGSRGGLPGQFKQASAVAVAPGGDVYVADTWNQRIQVFSPEGEYVREWGGSFYGPRGIAVGPGGEIYLADTGNHKVRKFNQDGVELTTWGALGSEPGQFKEPVGITVDDQGRVYVADNGNARIQIFDGNGGLLKMFSVPGFEMKVFSEPNIAVTPEGTIWVTIPAQRIIRAYSPDGEQLAEHVGREKSGRFGRPMGIVYDPVQKNLVVSDLENQLFRLETKTTP